MNVNKIAFERCVTLLELSRRMFAGDKALAKRYVLLARKIAMRHRLKLGSKEFCKKCNTPFIAGVTLKVRLNPKEKAVIYICLECGTKRRFGYSKGKTGEGHRKA